MRLKRLGWVVPIVVLWAVSSGSTQPRSQLSFQPIAPAVAAQAQPSSMVKKTAQFLEQFGGTYTKAAEAVWVVPFKGKALANLDVVVAVSPESNLLIIGATIAKKQNLRRSEPLLYRLLKYNHSADYVKVGFDDDDDLFVRAELNAKTVDFQSFKAVLEQVGAAADELYAQITPDLIATP